MAKDEEYVLKQVKDHDVSFILSISGLLMCLAGLRASTLLHQSLKWV